MCGCVLCALVVWGALGDKKKSSTIKSGGEDVGGILFDRECERYVRGGARVENRKTQKMLERLVTLCLWLKRIKRGRGKI